jgi:hypothetical protein
MDYYNIKRLALVLSIQAEIEAFKRYNEQHPDRVGYTMVDFNNKANELRALAYKHNEQL